MSLAAFLPAIFLYHLYSHKALVPKQTPEILFCFKDDTCLPFSYRITKVTLFPKSWSPTACCPFSEWTHYCDKCLGGGGPAPHCTKFLKAALVSLCPQQTAVHQQLGGYSGTGAGEIKLTIHNFGWVFFVYCEGRLTWKSRTPQIPQSKWLRLRAAFLLSLNFF